ncbi:hypothetical protein GGR51DRAFT_563801 [Nemania sp. FL0031]|nr:hypothetical protein GGR51DRAFT_563801 [Nemania sp. FL0031]
MDNKTDVSLQFVEGSGLPPADRAIFNILKASLEYTASTEIKSAKLAQDINFIVSAENRDDGIPHILHYIWSLILEISQCIPSEHPWQDSLLQAIAGLRQQDGIVPGTTVSPWKELPYLQLVIREHWIGPMENTEDEFARWQNLNSFVARLTSSSSTPGPSLPIWQLREALEEPPTKGLAQECRLWVACEWIIRCSGIIYRHMNLRRRDKRALGTGSLCRGVRHFRIDRWNFWKKRLAEITADAENLELGNAILERISHAIRTMEAVPEECS